MDYSSLNDYISKKSNSDQIINFKITKTDTKKKNNEELPDNKIDLIFSILTRLEQKIDSIEKRIGNDTSSINPIVNQTTGLINLSSNIVMSQNEVIMKEIRPQVFDDLDEKVLKAHLRKRRVESDGSLLYKIYFENLPRNLFPIRIVRKSSIEYWLNGHWNEDMDGEYIKETLSKNLIASYTKVNKFSASLATSVESDFMKNQNYILSLRDKKYQASLWDYLKKNYLY